MTDFKKLKKELHKGIDESEFSEDIKKQMHKTIGNINEEDLIKIQEDQKTWFEDFLKSLNTESENSGIVETITEKPKEELAKPDIDLEGPLLPENCYFECDPQGKEILIQLPGHATKKPIRIRQTGQGKIKVRLSNKSDLQHAIDASQNKYKFTDFTFNPGIGIWIANDRFNI